MSMLFVKLNCCGAVKFWCLLPSFHHCCWRRRGRNAGCGVAHLVRPDFVLMSLRTTTHKFTNKKQLKVDDIRKQLGLGVWGTTVGSYDAGCETKQRIALTPTTTVKQHRVNSRVYGLGFIIEVKGKQTLRHKPQHELYKMKRPKPNITILYTTQQ